MAYVTSTQIIQTLLPKVAKDFQVGELLVDSLGRVGIRTMEHIVRVDPGTHRSSLFVMSLEQSTDHFTLAPAGTGFTVYN